MQQSEEIENGAQTGNDFGHHEPQPETEQVDLIEPFQPPINDAPQIQNEEQEQEEAVELMDKQRELVHLKPEIVQDQENQGEVDESSSRMPEKNMLSQQKPGCSHGCLNDCPHELSEKANYGNVIPGEIIVKLDDKYSCFEHNQPGPKVAVQAESLAAEEEILEALQQESEIEERKSEQSNLEAEKEEEADGGEDIKQSDDIEIQLEQVSLGEKEEEPIIQIVQRPAFIGFIEPIGRVESDVNEKEAVENNLQQEQLQDDDKEQLPDQPELEQKEEEEELVEEVMVLNDEDIEIAIDTAERVEEVQGPAEEAEDVFRLMGYSADELVAFTVPGLSYYQQIAPPRTRASDDSIGDELISVREFGDIFQCSICFGILKGPVAVRSCLHKFCQHCLEELHRTSKLCPQCRSPIISRRVWRQDSRFSHILQVLIDDIDNFNMVEAECLEAELKKIFDFNLFSKVMREHFERQQRHALCNDTNMPDHQQQQTAQTNQQSQQMRVPHLAELQSLPPGLTPADFDDAIEEDKHELPLGKNQSASAAKATPLGIYSNLGERRRKIKQPQHFDFQLEMALNESRIYAQRMSKVKSKAGSKSAKALLKANQSNSAAMPTSQHILAADASQSLAQMNHKSRQNVAAQLKNGVLSPEALSQAQVNIESFEYRYEQQMAETDELSEDCHYADFIEQLHVAVPRRDFKKLNAIPRSVLTDVTQLDRSCFSNFETPVLIEFAVRYAQDASYDKLVTVPTDTTISQLQSYIIQRLVGQLYEKARVVAEVAAALPEEPPIEASQVKLFWRCERGFEADMSPTKDNQVLLPGREIELKDPNMKLQELISTKCWRIDNLTPGLDLLDNFWNLALQDNNYELIREKLYFRFVSQPQEELQYQNNYQTEEEVEHL